MNVFRLAACLALTAVGGLNAGSFAGDNWTSFQNGGRKSAGAAAVPGDVKWSESLPGYGQSSPLIWDEHVYTTSVVGDQKQDCVVSCRSLTDGSLRWTYQRKNSTPQESSTYVSRAAPTPVCDAAGLIAFFEGGNVVSLDHAGNLLWERDLVQDFGSVAARHGLASSLEQFEDRIFVWVERSEDPYVLCLERSTGQTVWKAAGIGATSWASPRVLPVPGGHHLVLSAIGTVAGFDIDTGARLWTLEGISGNSTPTPMPLEEGKFLLGATTGRGGPGGRAAESNGVIEVSRAADGWSADYVWRAKRATSSFGSPIALGDLALFVNREGVLYGLDRQTGEERFVKRLKGSVWATPFGQGNLVHFFQKDGRVESVRIDADGQSHTLWDKLPKVAGADEAAANGPGGFGGPVLYGVAVTDGLLLLRRGDQLTAVTLNAQEGTE